MLAGTRLEGDDRATRRGQQRACRAGLALPGCQRRAALGLSHARSSRWSAGRAAAGRVEGATGARGGVGDERGDAGGYVRAERADRGQGGRIVGDLAAVS